MDPTQEFYFIFGIKPKPHVGRSLLGFPNVWDLEYMHFLRAAHVVLPTGGSLPNKQDKKIYLQLKEWITFYCWQLSPIW
jgi:hypothetical protein